MITTKCGIYNLRNDDIVNKVLKYYNSYTARPLAFLSDALLFQWFWNNMYIILILILSLHVGNIFLLYKICDKIGIKLNAFSLTLFALSPILIQAIYWISASSRIVLSLFLCLSSIYLFILHFNEKDKTKKIIYLICGILLNLICVGYYEQTIALNLFLFAFVMILLKKYKYIFIPIISTTWIGAWYLHFMMMGQMQSRGALGFTGIFQTAFKLAKEIKTIYSNEYYNFLYSLEMGRENIFSVISIVLFVVISILIYIIFKNKYVVGDKKLDWKKLAIGFLFLIVPFFPFLVLKSSVIAVRNLYFSTLGLCIIIDALIDLAFYFIKNETAENIIKTCILGIVTILFVFANIDGAHNYKKVNDIDNKVVNQIIEAVGEEAFNNKKTISINYNNEDLYKYKNLSNYVESVVESGWALSGKLQIVNKNTNIGKIYINSMEDEADFVLYFDKNMNLMEDVYEKPNI